MLMHYANCLVFYVVMTKTKSVYCRKFWSLSRFTVVLPILNCH